MSIDINLTILQGNLGANPELRVTQTGLTIVNLRLATNESYKQGDEWKERVHWHRITLFGKNAENCAKVLCKGSSVFIQGRTTYGKYTDKQGNERWSTDIIAETWRYSGGPRKPVEARDLPSIDETLAP
jgi:single-strand DNA-binding protein